ncbi:MAG: hypothetical protein LGR52_01895 [Candidatus Thiosymbion ectosymbiont of Robbea hypermnestra]|nr:hypothetical protein [Candidatus Thiosymbion ectosymbiont of Robbea hypermnestra]
MTVKDQLKLEVDRLDERYLGLAYQIIGQFPHDPGKAQEKTQDQEIATLLQEIADAGGLGIANPGKWQQELRKDRPLPLRET